MLPQLTVTGEAAHVADVLASVLPQDNEPVQALLDGALDVSLYRCGRLTGVARFTDPTTKLTGGVQMCVGLPATRLESAQTLDARLRPGWTREQLIQRLTTLIGRARDLYELRMAREAVDTALQAVGDRGEWALAEAGLPDIEDLTLKETAHALDVLWRLV